MTIRRNQELTSKDDHHQPFFEEDGFQAHGVHSGTRTQNGFKIFSRDGWTYDSEQIKLLQQRRRGSTETPLFSKSTNGESGAVEGCDVVTEGRLESYLIKCFPAQIFGTDQPDAQLEQHILECQKCKDAADRHDLLVDALWAGQESKFDMKVI